MTALLVAFDLLLAFSLVALAAVTVTSREPRRAVILYIAFGLMLALVWARLRAPDLALAEAAIGAGLSGALMLAAARRAPAADPGTPSETRREGSE
jgi:energy-converting hydrogenase B subunit D